VKLKKSELEMDKVYHAEGHCLTHSKNCSYTGILTFIGNTTIGFDSKDDIATHQFPLDHRTPVIEPIRNKNQQMSYMLDKEY
jgi:hypothetical protein